MRRVRAKMPIQTAHNRNVESSTRKISQVEKGKRLKRQFCDKEKTRIKNQKRNHNTMFTYYAAHTLTHETLLISILGNQEIA